MAVDPTSLTNGFRLPLNMPVNGLTPIASTPAETTAFREQPGQFQSLFEETYGIPTAGRTPYQNWLSQQWRIPATEYSLSQAGVGPRPYTQGGTFQNYLQRRRAADAGVNISRLGTGYFTGLTDLPSATQQELLAILPSYVPQVAGYGRFQQRYPSFLAAGLTGQAFGQEQQRQFDISPEAIEGKSFLNYLRDKYSIGLGGAA